MIGHENIGLPVVLELRTGRLVLKRVTIGKSRLLYTHTFCFFLLRYFFGRFLARVFGSAPKHLYRNQ